MLALFIDWLIAFLSFFLNLLPGLNEKGGGETGSSMASVSAYISHFVSEKKIAMGISDDSFLPFLLFPDLHPEREKEKEGAVSLSLVVPGFWFRHCLCGFLNLMSGTATLMQ